MMMVLMQTINPFNYFLTSCDFLSFAIFCIQFAIVILFLDQKLNICYGALKSTCWVIFHAFVIVF